MVIHNFFLPSLFLPRDYRNPYITGVTYINTKKGELNDKLQKRERERGGYDMGPMESISFCCSVSCCIHSSTVTIISIAEAYVR
jgi:hypothetical protein